MKLPAYPRYKSSGVEWLGDIPEGWEVKRLKYIASANDDVLNENTPPDWELLYVDIGSVDAIAGITKKEQMLFEDAPSRARRRVSDGDTIVSTVRTYLRAIAPINQPEPNLVVSTGFAVVRPLTVDPAFLAFCLRSGYFVETVVSRSTGVSYPATTSSEVLTIPVPLPPRAEQQAIAAFLDRETLRLDQLASKKRELIERLKEKRKALISRVVTRGLPPSAALAAGLPEDPPYKSSGLDELPEIPSDWTISKVWLERVANNLEYQDGNHGELHPKAEDYVSDGIPFIMANHIIAGRIDFSICNYIEPELAASLRIGFAHAGDVLLTHKGTIGRVGVVQENQFPYVVLTPQVTYYRVLRHIFARYLFWFFQGRYWQDQMYLVSGLGTTRGYVGLLDQRSLKLILPPLSEQIAIANFLDAETAKLDVLVDNVETDIERLQEYRAAIITCAVTGKVDIREVAA